MTSTVSASTPLVRVLVGFWRPDEIEAYVQTTMQIDTRVIDAAKLSADYAAARDHVLRLGTRDETAVRSFNDDGRFKALQTEPTFQEFTSPGSPITFVKVDVRKLVVAQTRVDWLHIARLVAEAPEPGDDQALLDFCVPLQATAPVTAIQPSFCASTQTLSFVADNPDFRICGPIVDDGIGNGRAVLGFWVGPGLRQMSVTMFQGKHVLSNGHHRAIALVARGHTWIPTLLRHATHVEDTPVAHHGRFPAALVFGDAPPRVEDFLSPAAIDLPRRRTRTLHSFQAAQHAIVD